MMEVEVRKSGGHKKPGLRAGAEAGGDCVGGGKLVAPLWRPTGCGGAVVEEERGGWEEEERPHLQSTSTPPLSWLPFRLGHLPTICLHILIYMPPNARHCDQSSQSWSRDISPCSSHKKGAVSEPLMVDHIN